ncbi:DUF1552 domain-containing protein [Rubritalea spongiae]|uniref:DUF1552 domain-containing protein n=1 Tax=Rubritalea spongiae TaxID=430797 RepID=A0ABW5E312_9BACT
MNKSWKISRRTVLRGLGATMALPQLEIMAATTSSISGTTSTPSAVPLRFITMFKPNGVMPKDWDVTGVGKDYKMSPILDPLSRHREDINILSGINNQSSGHVKMTASFLTGVDIKNGKAGQSLDQRIADHIGQQTRFKSLVLGTEPPRQGKAGLPISIASTVSWSSETTRVSPEINPRIAFDRLFRGNTGPDAIKEAQMRKSVIDLVLEDAKSLRRKASYLDKEKIDEYLESVRSVETQLERVINPIAKDWEPPTQPSPDDFIRPMAGIPRERDKHLRLMMDILVLGLWTDTTRVGTIMAAHGFSRQNFSFIDGVSGDHHSISHHKGIPDKTKQYTAVSRWYVEQFAYLIDRLKGIDEGGSSLFDNSILLYGSGMKDGNGHKTKNLPLVVAGHGQGQIKTGSHLQLPSQPLSNLHYTLAQKYGIEDEDFNNTNSRSIPELS